MTFAGVALVLFGPKRVYTAMERTIGALVVIVTVGLIIIAFRVGTSADVAEMARGVVNIPFIEPDFPIKSFFIALVFAGAGGTANLFYAFYLRDKQIGMGARIPIMMNPIRSRNESVHGAGFTFPDTEDNRRRFRDWFRFIVLDQTLFFWALNTFTMFSLSSALSPFCIVRISSRRPGN